ncbi:4'-phosphopantetheinyl transferase family protein [Roseateles terrae]|uniref:4'-phosphopantetheinyl transferase n=1 Tax=Roseateles terrae TaxID=431060 RepID=A0ABR6GRB1_9BURK|nr:4'-phosphopantetheinyl transferase superfamily protein [Roseateles terrae]MBB3194251.1 4'-phosphopantetheinyl transferase [Roseateles terrae]OWQ88095.1 hypothetical protein CDN98_08120 [Roseateles terrae]
MKTLSAADERSTRLRFRLADQPALIARLPASLAWLSDSERARWEAFSTDVRRQTFLAGRWLARQTVAQWLGGAGAPGTDHWPTLTVAASGACEVAASASVFVSISHHGTQVACAVAAVPVGVDIEGPRKRRDVVALAGMVHGDAHQAALAQMLPQQRDASFLQAWTLKEAWLKARQQGLDFALMRSLHFDDGTADTADTADTAFTRHGDLFVALAAVPALPDVIDSPPGWIWRRCRSRRSTDPA